MKYRKVTKPMFGAKRNTWQGYIELDLPVESKTANYVMYRLEG